MKAEEAAIHCELSEDLRAITFYRAFLNFISLRGRPYNLISDNSKTFHKNEELINEGIQLAYSDIKNFCHNNNIKFNYTVEYSGHARGKIERQVGLIKFKNLKI